MRTLLIGCCISAEPKAFAFGLAAVATRRSSCEGCLPPPSEESALALPSEKFRGRGERAGTLFSRSCYLSVDWREMEKENIKMAMLRQEHTFRQQVHELHRIYQVQKQLMMQMQVTKMNNYGNTTAETQTEQTVKIGRQQWCDNSGDKKATLVEDFNLELTLATGAGRRKQDKPSNSDSEATMSSSTSAESESGRRFVPESNVTLRFQNSNRHDDQVMQSPWLYQCFKSQDGMMA
ncbi:uncharacterized protein LOC133906118 [Phragmites australis]|uniref:uncharacterized protein LOC133906118 n=1 Tax=Phragmites australis TaxID=29695 RepID=UPI002D7A3A68|nr:uncharacterized protein LOC133906118 [Phragmites australis]